MAQVRRSHAALLSLLSLAGCGGALRDGPNFDTHLLLPVAPDKVTSPAGTVQSPPPGSTTDGSAIFSNLIVPKDCADANTATCVPALRTIIDLKYAQYKIGLRALAVNTGAIGDLTSLALSGAATATGTAEVKTILSAINTAITGAKSTLNSDYLFGKTIDVVIQQMDTDRDGQFIVISTALNNAAQKPYSMTMAKDDLLQYYYDGTFAHALASLQADTAKTATQASDCKSAMIQSQDGKNPCPTIAAAATPGAMGHALYAPPTD